MNNRTLSRTAATLAVGVAVLAPTSALAAPARHCDAYSHHCVTTLPEKIIKPPTVVKAVKTTLPFTGAEIVLMTTVAGAALGTGGVLVVAGRRKRRSAPVA